MSCVAFIAQEMTETINQSSYLNFPQLSINRLVIVKLTLQCFVCWFPTAYAIRFILTLYDIMFVNETLPTNQAAQEAIYGGLVVLIINLTLKHSYEQPSL